VWLFSTQSHCTVQSHVISQRRPARRPSGAASDEPTLRKGQALTKYFPRTTIFTRLTQLIFSDINPVTCLGFEQAIIKLCVEKQKNETLQLQSI